MARAHPSWLCLLSVYVINAKAIAERISPKTCTVHTLFMQSHTESSRTDKKLRFYSYMLHVECATLVDAAHATMQVVQHGSLQARAFKPVGMIAKPSGTKRLSDSVVHFTILQASCASRRLDEHTMYTCCAGGCSHHAAASPARPIVSQRSCCTLGY